MEPVVELSKKAEATADEWVKTLKAFNEANKDNQSFIDRYSLATKLQFLDVLAKSLTTPLATWTPEVRTQALCALRLCLRESVGTEVVTTSEFFDTLMELANLESGKKQAPESADQQLEAAKCLVNLAMKDNPTIQEYFIGKGSVGKILELLKDPQAPKSLRFPFGRIVFILAMKDDICEQFNSLGAVDVFTDILEDSLKDLTQENIQNAAEAMKALFKLTISLGVLSDVGPERGKGREPTEKELAQFTRLVPVMVKVLSIPYSPQIHSLKEAVVNLLINVPTACTTMFPQEETLSALIEILSVQSKEEHNAAGALTPILLVLTSIAKAIPRARGILKRVVFPNCDKIEPSGVDAPKANLDPETIGARLISHMTTFNVGLKHYVNEFLFTLCDEDPNELVKQTGFGNAAGLLATHNLLNALGSGKASSVEVPPQKSPAPEELTREVDESVNGPDPKYQTGKPMGFLDTLTEDEKEREAEKLMTLLQKLEAQGMVKMVRKGEPLPPELTGGAPSSSSSSSSSAPAPSKEDEKPSS